jgi:hypothetical protein
MANKPIMPRVCTICSHPQRRQIEAALVACVPNTRIATKYAVDEAAVRYHTTNHVHATLTRARDALEITRGDELLEQVRAIVAKTWALLAVAESENDHALELKALAGLTRPLELLGRLMGELREQHVQQTVYNVVMLPEWVALRTIILNALEPFDDARLAVIAALEATTANGAHRLPNGNASPRP